MSSQLLITKDEFKADIGLRIAEGQAILKQYNPAAAEEELRRLNRALERWSKNNHAWLGHVFSKNSSCKRDYENAGAWDTEKVLAAWKMSPDSLRYKAKFFRQNITPKIEYLEDLLDTIEFLPVQREQSESIYQLHTMNGEEIIKNQAQKAIIAAERYGVHNHQGKYIEELREQSLKLYQPAAKATYFQEAIRLVEEKIVEHRAICKEGPGCPKEKKYEEALFFLQQELDILPKPVLAPEPTHQPIPTAVSNTGIEKIFISHSSKDAAIVEEVIDLLEVAGVEPNQIFCSTFEGYSIELGEDFLQRIKDELNSNVLVLFIITANFYASPVSLCEMGAAWVRTSRHIPIVVPPLSYDSIKGVIPNTHALIINDPLRWNTLKEQLERWLSIQNTASASVWERKRNKAIRSINSKIQPLSLPIERAKVRKLNKGGSGSAQ